MNQQKLKEQKPDTIYIVKKDTVIVQSKHLEEINGSVIELKEEISTIGKNTEPTFWGAKYDTVFTVAITLFIFIIGILIDRWIKRNQEKKELKELKDYFLNQVDELLNFIGPPFLKGYNKFYQQTININNGIPTTPPKLLTNSFDRILKMESEKLFSSFASDEKVKFNQYFGEIDFLSNLLTDINDYHRIVLQRSESIRNPLSEIDYTYIKLLADFCEFDRNNGRTQHTEFIENKIQHYYDKIAKGRHLMECYKEVVRPIQDYIIANNLMRTHPIGNKIGELGKLYSTKYNHLRMLIMEVRCQYRTFAHKIKQSLDKIEQLK